MHSGHADIAIRHHKHFYMFMFITMNTLMDEPLTIFIDKFESILRLGSLRGFGFEIESK